MADTYTVKKGDTLSDIAAKFKSKYGYTDTYKYVSELVKLNDISDPGRIVVGQVLQLSGTASPPKANTTSRPTIKLFGLQSNTDRTMYVTWSWDKSNTKEYNVVWYYATGDGVWFVGNDGTVKVKQSVYSAPSNAISVKVKVKPISDTYEVNKKVGETTTTTNVNYWVAGWSTEKIYYFSSNPPTKPPKPTVKIEKFKLTAELTNLDVNAETIHFQVVKDDAKVYKTGDSNIVTSSASWSCQVVAGSKYKVRCYSKRGTLLSDWSEYTDNLETIPTTPLTIPTIKATSATSVLLKWLKNSTATSYELEYATKKSYFDGSDQTTVISSITTTTYEKTGLESGSEYFFRLRAVNAQGSSGWSQIRSIKIGKAPSAPTTWSSTTTAIVGEPLNLYWMHNSEDGSTQKKAYLELYVNGVKSTKTLTYNIPEDKEDEVTTYSIDTSEYDEGAKIEWRVKTAGIVDEYSEWSVQRTVDIYAPPVLEMEVRDYDNELMSVLTSFPFYVHGSAFPATQTPVGYHLSIIANNSYETVDNVGNVKNVSAGDEVYSKYFDISANLLVELSANNLNLENNVSYTVKCSVTMDSGLTAEETSTFSVAWTDNEYEPNAELAIDEATLSAYIHPFCKDIYGRTISGITLSVYRREYDGSFVELATDLDNAANTFITDPHPSLDYARYRIVAKSTATGAISYYDMPGYPVGGKSVVIQWDDDWSEFDPAGEESALEQQPWAGSMLILPYNIDVSDNYKPDTELVEYIGRKHPVSYYGTQQGVSATWNISIPKNDKDTLYALRRLSVWMGDVYVREPSGSGYWANIVVSFSQKHAELTIPVTLSITRVEGGV